MLSFVDACLGRLPGPLVQAPRLVRLIAPLRLRPALTAAPRHFAGPAAGAAGALAQRSRRLHVAAAVDDFYAASSVTFSSLGLSDDVCAALQAAGYPRPAHAQELAVPAILRGEDVVLAAETGSGKTLAYVAPLADLALRSRQAQAAAAAAEAGGEAGGEQDAWAGHARRHRATAALVLCPNGALCDQVLAAAAEALRDPGGGPPLAAAALVSAQCPPPAALPDIVVATPGGLLSLLDNSGAAYGHEWTRAGLPGWARAVVFDEADLLLAGGYGAQMRILWDALRGGDRLHAARRVCAQAGLSEDEFGELPYHLRRAALKDGLQGLLDAGFRPRQPLPPAAAAAPDGAGAHALQPGPEGERAPGVHGPSWRRQYIFVAATMPAEGERSVGAEIAARFPDATWLAGKQLHQSKRAVQHSWRALADEAERAAALQEVLASDEQLQAGGGRMLVFARDVAAAEATAAALGGAGLPQAVLQYHKRVPAEERAAALQRMATEEGLVMVCTDAAARGLDVPEVTHVVQADFAGSAIDFLHRVGRTARAGRAGRVTSLYTPDVAPLVEAIQANIEAGLPVEGAFSRKRSFRKKLRKYGEYVPRGQEGSQESRERAAAERASRPPQEPQQQERRRGADRQQERGQGRDLQQERRGGDRGGWQDRRGGDRGGWQDKRSGSSDGWQDRRSGSRDGWQDRRSGSRDDWQDRRGGSRDDWQDRRGSRSDGWQDRRSGSRDDWQERRGAGRGDRRGDSREGRPERRWGDDRPQEDRRGGGREQRERPSGQPDEGQGGGLDWW